MDGWVNECVSVGKPDYLNRETRDGGAPLAQPEQLWLQRWSEALSPVQKRGAPVNLIHQRAENRQYSTTCKNSAVRLLRAMVPRTMGTKPSSSQR